MSKGAESKGRHNRKGRQMNRISTFDDWISMLDDWRRDIGLDRELVDRFMPGYNFEAKYGELPTPEIYFGDFKGDRRWERVREIPDQRMRDAVLNKVSCADDNVRDSAAD